MMICAEQQLEIFDLLCSGRKLTKEQELAAKLAAKYLVESIEKNLATAFRKRELLKDLSHNSIRANK